MDQVTSQISEESRPAGEIEPGQDPNRWKALAICLAGGFMVLLDISIVNVALPSMAHGLHASGDQIQWVLSGYSLTFGLLLVPAGRLGDARGRRRLWVIGLVSFTAASLLCGAAPNADWLVVARLLQGLAAGLLTPQISALIQQLFRGQERGKAFGLFGAMVGVSTALGPLIGGVLIQIFGQTDGWRYVFFVNLPIGLLAAAVRAAAAAGHRRPSGGRRKSTGPGRGAAAGRRRRGAAVAVRPGAAVEGQRQVAAGAGRAAVAGRASWAGRCATAAAARIRWSTSACSPSGPSASAAR